MNLLNTIGLCLDIIGAILIFIFPFDSNGLSLKGIDYHLKNSLELEGCEKNEIQEAKSYMMKKWWNNQLSRTGMFLIFVGFLFQLLSSVLSSKSISQRSSTNNCENQEKNNCDFVKANYCGKQTSVSAYYKRR